MSIDCYMVIIGLNRLDLGDSTSKHGREQEQCGLC